MMAGKRPKLKHSFHAERYDDNKQVKESHEKREEGTLACFGANFL